MPQGEIAAEAFNKYEPTRDEGATKKFKKVAMTDSGRYAIKGGNKKMFNTTMSFNLDMSADLSSLIAAESVSLISNNILSNSIERCESLPFDMPMVKTINSVSDSLSAKPEDFIRVPVRALTKTIVGAYTWKASDFGSVDMENTVDMANGLTIYPDHNASVENFLGRTAEAYYQGDTVVGDRRIPGGINVMAYIDTVANPKIARGMATGQLNSMSVTVNFDWKPSHEFKKADDFYKAVGSIASDGKMVRRIVTKINGYAELSIVYNGADPYAKTLDASGNVSNPYKPSIVNYSAENVLSYTADPNFSQYSENKKFSIVEFGENNINLLNTSVNKSNQMFKTIQSQYGSQLPSDVKDEASFLAFVGDLLKRPENIPTPEPAKLSFKSLELNDEPVVTDASVEVTTNDADSFIIVKADSLSKVQAAFAAMNRENQSLAALREEALKQFNVAGDKSETELANYKGILANSTAEQINTLTGNLKEVHKFGAFCTKCKSKEHISMRSSADNSEDVDKNSTQKAASVPSAADIRNKYTKKI